MVAYLSFQEGEKMISGSSYNIAGHNRRVIDLRPRPRGPVGETILFSFKCTLGYRDPVAPETDPVAVVNVAAGYTQIIGAAPASVAATQFDVGTGGSVYAVWTYTTDGTPGAWSSPVLAYGTPPTEDETKRVVIIATITDGVLAQRHLGDVVVLDIVDRTDCV